MVTDPIADLLARIRNASNAKHEVVVVPHSTLKLNIIRLLYEEGFIGGYKVVEGEEKKSGGIKMIEISLKYTAAKQPVIGYLRRYSRPGLRFYQGYQELKPVRNGTGIMILSTSKGVLTDAQARTQKVGGEPLCVVW